jgi:curved DNA-binding protein CbpA
MDPFHVLGVPPGSTDTEIKAAYRKAAMRWHPDRNTASGPEAAALAEKQFKAVNDAYDYLSNNSGRGPQSGSSSQSSGRTRQRPWSSYAASGGPGSGSANAGAYTTEDPFGFRTGRGGGTTGDHMRRIDRNLRVLYVSLAFIAGLIYVAPSPISPMEAAKARRRRETRAHARGETHRFVEKANVSLAPGSPLYARQGSPLDGRYGGTWMDAARGDEAWGGDETYERFRRASGELPGVPGGARRFYDGSFDGRGADGRRSVGEVEQRAALHAGWQRARFGAKVVANAGGTLSGGNGQDVGRDFVGPEWASGGFAGAGISRRVLPYQRGEERGGNGHGNGRGPGGSNAEIQCAKCGYELSRAARYCGMCGTRTTSPGSVVRRPYADPQDTGTSVGRGRERARAAAEAAARVAAADGEASSDGDPR